MSAIKYPRQLLLDLNLGYSQTFDNFITGNNQELCNMLQSLHPYEYGYDNSIYCWSVGGSGKSHLLRAYCAYWQEQGMTANYISGGNLLLDDINFTSNKLSVMVFDDIQTVLGSKDKEEYLLSLLLKCYEENIPFLCSANSPPSEINCALNDLATRLATFYVFKVEPLNHKHLKEFIYLEADRLGLSLNPELIEKIYSSQEQVDMKLIAKLIQKLATKEEQNGLLSAEDISSTSELLRH